MALSKSTITGRVPLPTDENLQFAELTFALSGLDTEGASVLPGGVSTRAVLIGSDIPAGFELWQNTAGLRGTHYQVLARWTVKDRDGIRDQYADLGIIQIGSDPSYTLADLINNGVPPAIGTFWMSITQAQYDALYDGPRVDTFAQLVALTAGDVAVGEYVQVRSLGAWYKRAADAASDSHLTHTSAVLKWYVMPSAAGYAAAAFGALQSGQDDWACVAAAIAVANSKVTFSFVANWFQPEATVVLDAGQYDCASIATAINVLCNITNLGAHFVIPNAYAGTVLTIGPNSGINLLMGAKIETPEISKAHAASIIVGSIAVAVRNVFNTRIKFGEIRKFETTIKFAPNGIDCSHNLFTLGNNDSYSIGLDLAPASGTAISVNVFESGALRHGPHAAGNIHLRMVAQAGSSIINNTFNGLCLQGPGADYLIYADGNVLGNTFNNYYHETGTPSVSVSVSGDTLTTVGAVAHGFAVGDMVRFAFAYPSTVIFAATNYYVTDVPSSTTFKMSPNKSGSAVTWGPVTGGVFALKNQRVLFKSSVVGTAPRNNKFVNGFSPDHNTLDIIQQDGSMNNTIDDPVHEVRWQDQPNSYPFWRGGFKAAGKQPIIAAYAPNVDPEVNPGLWLAGLSKDGVVWPNPADGTTSHLGHSYGNILAVISDAVYYLPKSLVAAATTVTFTVTANSHYDLDVTVTGAAVGDFAKLSIPAALTAGLIQGQAWIAATNTLRQRIHNVTGSDITMTSIQVRPLVTKKIL